MLTGSPVNAHDNWLYAPHLYMVVSLKLIATRLLGVSECDDRGSVWRLPESRMSGSARSGRYAAFCSM